MCRSGSEFDAGGSNSDVVLDRRRFVAALAASGVGGGLFPGVLWARAQDQEEITADAIQEAARLAGLSFTAEERQMMLERLRTYQNSYSELRTLDIPPDVPPALLFESTLARPAPAGGSPQVRPGRPETLPDPSNTTDLAFATIGQLGGLLRTGAVTSVELTRLYLGRLRRFGPVLRCVVTLTEETAMEQAERADREMADGRPRGPLHGIPWGAKDLLSVRGYPTTWGAPPYRDRTLNEDATVVRRLSEAGAVLVAKLSLGELAMGDEWFGGRTRNPWAPAQGSSGSSAGSAAATAAGLVGFALGSETLGSIVSPASRCGVTGLRPTFGRVSRRGAMPLAWSMDKIGPICRSAEDCAVVLAAIQGPDGLDPTVRAVPWGWDGDAGAAGLRVGYLNSAFAHETSAGGLDGEALASLSAMEVDLRGVELPTGLPLEALRIILDAEAAAAFDELTRGDLDDRLVGQGEDRWPNRLRVARFVPAVEYIRANRIRTMLLSAMEEAWTGLDVIVAPTFAPGLLIATNLSGHPAVVVPSGLRPDGTPGSLSFIGPPWGEAEVLRLAKAYQERTLHHLDRPPAFS